MRSSLKSHTDLRGLWKLAAGIALFIAAMITVQVLYARHHAPLMLAESIAANTEGEPLFQSVGTPPGSKPAAFGEKRYLFAGKSQWKGAFRTITLERTFEMPGDYPASVAWYREHLLAAGWQDYQPGQPSTVIKQFKKGKWIANLWRSADFPKYTKVRVELTWRYRAVTD
jgi:hypothetical protein